MGKKYFNCDLGCEVEEDIQDDFYEWNHVDHWHIQKYNPDVLTLPDNTRIHGYFQTEKYIENRDLIKQWLPTPKYSPLSPKLCVINFRGGDYVKDFDVYLHQRYWLDSISYVKSIDNEIEFLVLSDDIKEASKYLPDYEIKSPEVFETFCIISNANYLIIPNSSFSWWAAYLNDKAKVIIAPKYWLRHNVSSGWWSPSDSLSTKFTYLDRDGKISSYLENVLSLPQNNYDNFYY